MTDIAQALTELDVKEWILRGEPTTKEEFASMFVKIIGTGANGLAIESSKESDWGTTWEEVKAKKDELLAAEPMRQLRAQRDIKIAKSDWMANSDVTMTDAWKTYRQALRDITSGASPTLTENGMLDESSVTWPTEPS